PGPPAIMMVVTAEAAAGPPFMGSALLTCTFPADSVMAIASSASLVTYSSPFPKLEVIDGSVRSSSRSSSNRHVEAFFRVDRPPGDGRRRSRTRNRLRNCEVDDIVHFPFHKNGLRFENIAKVPGAQTDRPVATGQ